MKETDATVETENTPATVTHQPAEALAGAASDLLLATLRFVGGGACSNTGSTKRGCRTVGIKHICAMCQGRDAITKAGVSLE